MSKRRVFWRRVGLAGLLALAVALLGLAVAILVQVDLRNQDDLAAFVDAKLARAGAVGAAVAIVAGENVAWSHDFGLADRESARLVTDETLFAVASVSKTVTGAAVMQLVELGLVDLDDDCADHLPVRFRHPRFPERPLTVRMLLAHTAGLRDDWETLHPLYTIDSGGGDAPNSLRDVVEGFLTPGGRWYDAQKNFTATAPGEGWEYSNLGYGVLGLLVETVTGIPFPVYCRENIFAPLQMRHTCWLIADLDRDLAAVPYRQGARRLPHYSFPTYPDGSLRTSAHEYARFLAAMAHEGRYRNQVILQPETVRLMLEPQARDGRQCLTWHRSPLADLLIDGPSAETVGHTGGDPGALSVVLFNPRKKTGLIVLMNSDPALNLRAVNLYLMLRRLVREADV